MKKVILVSLLASSVLFNTACNDREIAAGIIGIGIGIGIAAGDHDHDRDHHHHDRRRHDYDHGRRHYPPPRHDRNPPPRYRRYYAADLKLETPFDTKAVSSDILAFSKKYNVSTDAAAKIKVAFDGVKSKGLESFETIGLSKKDIRAIAKRDLPESSSIKAMADKLDIAEHQSRDLIKDLIAEFDDQASDIESPYWQSCMSEGKSWRTPQNLYCTNTAWNGCSPDTGATLCY